MLAIHAASIVLTHPACSGPLLVHEMLQQNLHSAVAATQKLRTLWILSTWAGVLTVLTYVLSLLSMARLRALLLAVGCR
jgi:hypothetical protein